MKNFLEKTTLLIALLISVSFYAQERTITGTVSDDMGEVSDISVIVQGTSKGTVTDFDGKYSITAKKGDVLVFSHVSYATSYVTVKDKNVINVLIKASKNTLSEVVITSSCFKRKKWNLFRKKRHAKVASRLSGKASGSRVKRTNKRANNSSRIVLRGVRTFLTANEPLIVIDGVVKTSAEFKKMDPSKVKRVNVLKGAKGAALYGTQGSNGVIVVVTKNISDEKIEKEQQQKIYIIDGKKTTFKEYAKMNPAKISTIQEIKNKSLIELYGKKAKNGVIYITTRQEKIQENESYDEIVENQFENVTFAPLSTFSIDVDKASYSNIRRMINNGQEIPADAVKIEEMINYFNYNYDQPIDEHPFSIQTEVAMSPFNKDAKIVKIGLQGKKISDDNIPASNLVFLIDVSGSMSSSNKLPLLKSSFKLLVKQLRNKDKISIVVYAGAAGVVLKPTSGDDKNKILRALNKLQSGGSTAGGQGIKLAYKLAKKNFIENGNNRIILATDGDFNVGASSNKSMEELIVEERKSGVYLTVLGFGMGNYKDSKLETLADKGNGNHAYIDTMQEANRVLGTEFGGTLYTIAKDVKIQVEFNPNKVQAYRLIGYENRLLNDEDFVDDTKDAGELGSNHNVTALYEIIPVGVKSEYLKEIPNLKYTKTNQKDDFNDELLTVKFRYKKPNKNKSIEMVHVTKDAETYFNNATIDFRFSTAVAMFGMKLRDSKFIKETNYKDILTIAKSSKGIDENGYRAEFINLVKTLN